MNNNTLCINDFISEVKSLILKTGFFNDIKERIVSKINESDYNALILCYGAGNCFPSFNMNVYYNDYIEGASIEDIVGDIMTRVNNASINIDVESFVKDFSKTTILRRLVNYELNKELLKTVPYVKFGDLAIIFRVVVDMKNPDFSGSILVNNNFLQMWKVSIKDVYYASKLEETAISDMGFMFTMSNINFCYGAANILDFETLSSFSESVNSSLIVIPSSVHEFLLIPDNDEITEENVCEIIEGVNSFELPKEEILGNHPYYFNKDTKRLYLSKNGAPMFVEI